MSLDEFIQIYQPAIEGALSETIALSNGTGLEELHRMMAYHLGWIGEGAGPSATGKRIRPLLVLLTTQASGGDWHKALPAAAAVELIHNFSLIHDDIEDNSTLRRGRPSIWVKWGIPLAINTGDTMFTLAHLAVLDIEKTNNHHITLEAVKILQTTCLHLTQGQHLDISYEDEQVLPVEAYWLAFQALDDILGIWGDSVKIGKSNASDLVAGKKSLPVLYGLAQNGEFAKRWLSGPITPDEVPELANRLDLEGARDYTQNEANRLTESAINALERAQPQGTAGQALKQLTHQLLQRKV